MSPPQEESWSFRGGAPSRQHNSSVNYTRSQLRRVCSGNPHVLPTWSQPCSEIDFLPSSESIRRILGIPVKGPALTSIVSTQIARNSVFPLVVLIITAVEGPISRLYFPIDMLQDGHVHLVSADPY
jgi:hypothetical protein